MDKKLAGLITGLVFLLVAPIANAALIKVMGDFSAGPEVFSLGTVSGSFSFHFDDSAIVGSGFTTILNIPLASLIISPNYGGFDLSNVSGGIQYLDGNFDIAFIGANVTGQSGIDPGTNDFIFQYTHSISMNQFAITQEGEFGLLVDETDGIPFSGSLLISQVPIPAAIWLFGSGLLGLVGTAARHKKAQPVKTL